MRFSGGSDVFPDVARYFRAQPALRGRVVVDLPAGQGKTAAVLHELGANVEAYDLFPEFFKVPGLECRKADLCRPLPIADAHADYLICEEGIEHVPDQLTMLRDFNRVLRPGGRLLITTPNASSLRARLTRFLVESEHYSRQPPSELDSIWFSGASELYFGHLFLLDVHKLRVLARLSGFKLEAIHSTKASRSSFFLALLLLPLIAPIVLYANLASRRRHRKLDPDWVRSVCGESLWLSLHPTVLFCRTLFIEFVKERLPQECVAGFHNKLKG